MQTALLPLITRNFIDYFLVNALRDVNCRLAWVKNSNASTQRPRQRRVVLRISAKQIGAVPISALLRERKTGVLHWPFDSY